MNIECGERRKPTNMTNILGTTENLELKDENNIVRYKFYKSSSCLLIQYTYDKNNRIITYENSEGDWYKFIRDDIGNELAFEDSDGHYSIKGKRVTKEEFENFAKYLKK